jgi:hypothetical protein
MRRSCAGLLFFAILGFAPTFAAEPSLAGDYDRAIVAVDGDLITGYFRDCTGECKFSCNVFFEGQSKPGKFAIRTYYPGETGTIEGVAEATGKGLNLRLKAVPDGCWNVTPEFATQGVEMLREPKADWLQIRVLRRKSHLYKKPDGMKAAELQEHQTVIVLRKKVEWFFVRKPGVEKISGWLRQRDLFPLKSLFKS